MPCSIQKAENCDTNKVFCVHFFVSVNFDLLFVHPPRAATGGELRSAAWAPWCFFCQFVLRSFPKRPFRPTWKIGARRQHVQELKSESCHRFLLSRSNFILFSPMNEDPEVKTRPLQGVRREHWLGVRGEVSCHTQAQADSEARRLTDSEAITLHKVWINSGRETWSQAVMMISVSVHCSCHLRCLTAAIDSMCMNFNT